MKKNPLDILYTMVITFSSLLQASGLLIYTNLIPLFLSLFLYMNHESKKTIQKGLNTKEKKSKKRNLINTRKKKTKQLCMTKFVNWKKNHRSSDTQIKKREKEQIQKKTNSSSFIQQNLILIIIHSFIHRIRNKTNLRINSPHLSSRFNILSPSTNRIHCSSIRSSINQSTRLIPQTSIRIHHHHHRRITNR